MRYFIFLTIFSLGFNSNLPGIQDLKKPGCIVMKKRSCPFSKTQGCQSKAVPFSCPKDAKKTTCQKKLLNRDIPKDELKSTKISLDINFGFLLSDKQYQIPNLKIATNLKPEKPDPPGYSPLLI